MTRQLICAIVGRKATSNRWDDQQRAMAELAGGAAARAGFAVLTGGHSGVMEYAAKGAKEHGGVTLGILTTARHEDGNPWLDFVLPSGMGTTRNALTALACDVMVGLPGGWGTLQEMTFAHEAGRPVFSWSSWQLEGEVPCELSFDATGIGVVRQWLDAQYARRRAEIERSAS